MGIGGGVNVMVDMIIVQKLIGKYGSQTHAV